MRYTKKEIWKQTQSMEFKTSSSLKISWITRE